MRILNSIALGRARSPGYESAIGCKVAAVRTLIVAAIAVTLMLPLVWTEATGATTLPSEFSHVVATDGCTGAVRSEVTATSGNHSGQHVRWRFWTTKGDAEELVRIDDQQFTARNSQTLVSTATYVTDNYHVEVSVWKARRDGSMVRVGGDTASGSLSCP